MRNLLTFDIEDWFHILDLETTPSVKEWARYEPRVEKNARSIFDLLDRTKTKATCFFLGWVAERYPDLVKDARSRGHDIASHGYAHQLVDRQSRREFAADIARSKEIIESLTNTPCLGYRAPGFSVSKKTPWFFEEVAKAGYRYDSSVFPARHGHGGMMDAPVFPHDIETEYGIVREFPISVIEILGRRICFSGGGYLRLSPYGLIRLLTHRVNRQKRPVVYYLHPREIDPGQPRLRMGAKRRFRSYVNLHSTMSKLTRLTSEQQLTDLRSGFCQHPFCDVDYEWNTPPWSALGR